MSTKEKIEQRSGKTCELCAEIAEIDFYDVPPQDGISEEKTLMLCGKCLNQIEKKEEPEPEYWKSILPNSMWHELPAVQVVSWRMLNRFRTESWASDLLDMMYFDDETYDWAKATGEHESDASVDLHRDVNGNVLQPGDTVVLIKSLDVKGSTLNAKMGTAVRNIRLVPDNTGQIEGRVEGQLIVILTRFVRKQNA